MNYIEIVKEHLQGKGMRKSITPSGLPFVTVSRESGAGGHLLAHVIITDLMNEIGDIYQDWEVVDKEICYLLGENPEMKASMEAILSEKTSSEWTQFIDGLFSGKAEEYKRHKMTFNIIRLIAMLGKVVIVGRAGAFVTAGMPGGIHVRLVARPKAREQWMIKKFKVDHDKARKMMLEQDSDKKRLVESFFHADIADPTHYNCVWNSETTDMHEISAAIISIIKMKLVKKIS